MASIKDISIRDVWWVVIVGKYETKSRPAVVVSIDGEAVTVVYGGSHPDPRGQHIAVYKLSDEWRAMGLQDDTFFRHSNVAVVTPKAFTTRHGRVGDLQFTDYESIEFNYSRKRR